MQHELINTIVAGLVGAFICGFIAKKLNFPAILGYLIAGIIIGPYTPGFVADTSLAQQLAEIGIILLMFGVGLHFSFEDLLRVRKIALPGALFQMLTATLLGALVMVMFDQSWVTGLIYGFSLSVASTVVLLRALESRKAVQTAVGKIAIGWLIVEDIAMVLALVILPTAASMAMNDNIQPSNIAIESITVIIKIAAFVVLMMYFGRKLLPKLLNAIASTKSNELITLGTLAIALGFAYIAYSVFDASFALGAFLAGMVISESEVGYKAAEKSLPMREAFAVLFFVSVGMLFNPAILIEQPIRVVATLLTVVVGKGLAAIAITTLFKQTRNTSLVIAICLAQIGEFSFILAGVAMTAGLLTQDVYSLILAGALLSIGLNPFLFKLLDLFIAKENSQMLAIIQDKKTAR